MDEVENFFSNVSPQDFITTSARLSLEGPPPLRNFKAFVTSMVETTMIAFETGQQSMLPFVVMANLYERNLFVPDPDETHLRPFLQRVYREADALKVASESGLWLYLAMIAHAEAGPGVKPMRDPLDEAEARARREKMGLHVCWYAESTKPPDSEWGILSLEYGRLSKWYTGTDEAGASPYFRGILNPQMRGALE